MGMITLGAGVKMIKAGLLVVLLLTQVTAATAQTTNCKVGLAQYQSLATGMSYSRAVAVLGCELEGAGHVVALELSRDEAPVHREVAPVAEREGVGHLLTPAGGGNGELLGPRFRRRLP